MEESDYRVKSSYFYRPEYIGIHCQNKKEKRSNHDAIIVLCSSILFKHCYQNMSIVQKIVFFTLVTQLNRLVIDNKTGYIHKTGDKVNFN